MNVGYAFTASLVQLVSVLLELYMWALIISAVMSWFIAFEVINPRSPAVQTIGNFLHRITEPALRPIRRIIPPVGGVDLSPLALIFIIWFLRLFLFHLVVG